MERNFIRATLVFVWRCPHVKDPRLTPERVFGEGSTFSIGDGAVVFQSPPDPVSGISDELAFGPTRLTLASSFPDRIPKIFERAWEVFSEITEIQLLAAGYNAEYEWLKLAPDTSLWLAENLVRVDQLKVKGARCTSLSLAFEDTSGRWEKPCFVNLEPRAHTEDGLFALVAQHFDEVPKDLDRFCQGIVPFASSLGADIVESIFPLP
jgi:hypothetical protein